MRGAVDDMKRCTRSGAEQFEAVNQFVSKRLVPMHVSTDDVRTFQGRARSTTLGVIELSEIRSRNAFVARRTSKLITSGDPDYLKVGVQLSGESVVSQLGREATLGPGDFVLYDTARPYQLSAGASFHMQAVLFSRDALRLSPSQMEWLITRPMSGREGLGRLLTQYLAGVAQQLLDSGSPSGRCHLADATLDLLAACFAERLATQTCAIELHGAKAGLLLRVRTHIEQRLGDPDLDVISIAKAHHVSVRTLHTLFEDQEQTVSGWIRSRRIEHCRRDLANPALAGESVSSIAAKWGLLDPAHFSRLFKAAHGWCPRDYRARAHARGTTNQSENTDEHVAAPA